MFNSGFRGKRAADGEGTVSNQSQFVQAIAPIPTINNFVVTDGNYDPIGDTAADPAGGQTIVLNGSGFAAGATIMVGNTVITPVTYLGPTRLAFTSLAASSGSYTVFVTNTSGGTGILLPGLVYSGLPTFTTPAGSLGSYYETTAISNTIVATGDVPITYSVSAGTLPPGSTLSSGGVLTGTSPVDASSTTYSFTVQATDAEFQDSYRSFSLTINTDVVTWVAPADNTAYIVTGNSPIANVTLTATSAAGYNVSYAANALPTGVSVVGNVIAGTPTVAQSVSTLLTATAATTGRSATRNISWTVNIGDPYFNYVSMLVTTNGVNAATNNTFIDGSSNAWTITRTGTPTQGTFSQYSQMGWSNYFSGSGDYLSTTANTAFAFGTGDYTIEAWVYRTASGVQRAILDLRGGANVNVLFYMLSSNKLAAFNSSSTWITSTNIIPLNQWTHVALTRSGTSAKFFINGTVDATATNSDNNVSSGAPYIGRQFGSTANDWQGYISNIRVVKGQALYTSNFTPSTAPLTTTSQGATAANVSLLTCQSNRFVDNSSNAFALTSVGTPSVQAYTPFAPSGTWSSTTNGGSGYFDGSGDYLDVTTGIPVPTTGQFTFETWVYTTKVNSAQVQIIYSQYSTSNANRWTINISTANKLVVTHPSLTVTGATTVPLNQWNHVAVTRDASNTLRIFLNGVVDATSASYTYSIFQDPPRIGYYKNSPSDYFTGYMGSLRVISGTAIYTSAFTPPTAPLTAISGTTLLLNFINAGVYDAHSSSDLATIGTAQVSTAQTKYDAASVYFAAKTDYAGIKPIPPLTVFAGDFTVECWVYPSNNTITTWGIWDSRQTAGSAAGMVFSLDPLASPVAGSYRMKYYNATAYYGTTTVLSGQWTYLTWVRSGTTMTFYVNGTAGGTATISGTQTGAATTAEIYIGSKDNATAGIGTIGYIESLRITNGVARYTGNFTPPTGSVPQS